MTNNISGPADAPNFEGNQFHAWNPKWSYLEQRHFAILAACDQPQTFQRVLDVTRIPRATGHRFLKKLMADGLISKSGESFMATNAGRQVLTSPLIPPRCADILHIWPFLRKMPSPIHSSMAILILLGIIARQSNLSSDQYPSFCLLGKSGQLKTWLLKVLCKELGLSMDDCLKLMPQARPRSLIGRLDGQGQLAWQNPALQQPLLGLLEHAKAKPDVKEDVATLLQGTATVYLDDHAIKIKATMVVELNFVKGEATTLQDQTGFDLSQRRRLLIANFTGVDLTPSEKAAAFEYLEGFHGKTTIHLPNAGLAALPEESKTYIRRSVTSCVKESYVEEIDFGRLETLVRAATSIYPDPLTATRFVIGQVLEIFASTNFTKEDWRSVFASFNNPGDHQPTEPVPQAASQTWEGLCSNLEGRGENPRGDSEKIAALLQIIRDLRGQNLSDAEIFVLLENIPKLLKLNLLLHRLDLDPESALSLKQIEQALAACGCTPEQAQDAIEAYLALNQLGLTSESAWTFAHSIVEAIEEGGEARVAARNLLEAAREQISLQAEIKQSEVGLQRLTQRRSEVEREIGELSNERDRFDALNDKLYQKNYNLSARSDQLEQENDDLDNVHAQKLAAVNALQERENEIRGKCLTMLVLYRLLYDPKYNIDPAVRAAIEDVLYAIKSGGYMGNLKDAFVKIMCAAEKTRARFAEPLDEFEILEAELVQKRAECLRMHETKESLEKNIADLTKTLHLLRACEVCISPKPGQEILRQNLMVEMDRLNGLMIGRLKSPQPQAEVDAIADRIRLLLDGGLGEKSGEAAPT